MEDVLENRIILPWNGNTQGKDRGQNDSRYADPLYQIDIQPKIDEHAYIRTKTILPPDARSVFISYWDFSDLVDIEIQSKFQRHIEGEKQPPFRPYKHKRLIQADKALIKENLMKSL